MVTLRIHVATFSISDTIRPLTVFSWPPIVAGPKVVRLRHSSGPEGCCLAIWLVRRVLFLEIKVSCQILAQIGKTTTASLYDLHQDSSLKGINTGGSSGFSSLLPATTNNPAPDPRCGGGAPCRDPQKAGAGGATIDARRILCITKRGNIPPYCC